MWFVLWALFWSFVLHRLFALERALEPLHVPSVDEQLVKRIADEEQKEQQQSQERLEHKRFQLQQIWNSILPVKLSSNAQTHARKWHVVNLERRKDRWERISKHFEAHGFDVARMSAVDARSFPPDLREGCGCEKPKDRQANFNHIACGLSHAALLDTLANTTTDPNAVFLIAEDDAHIVDVKSTHELISAFESQTVCNLLNLGFGVRWTPKTHEQIAPGLWRATGRSILMHAYAVKQSVMKSIANQIRAGMLQLAMGRDRRHFGCDVVWVFAPGVQHCIPRAPSVEQLGGDSDIELSS